MPTATNSQQRAMPMQTRALPVASVDAEKRTVELVWTTGAQVRRYDYYEGQYYYEELEVSTDAIDLSRLNNGGPLLAVHNQYSLSSVLGVVERAWVADGQGHALVRFSERPDVEPIWQDVVAGIIRNVSVGYNVTRWLLIEDEANLPIYRAVAWQPTEISLVPIGADADAGTRADPAASSGQTFPYEFINPPAAAGSTQERTMPEPTQPAATSTATPQPAAPDAAAIRAEAQAEERQRIATIQQDVRTANLDSEFAVSLIERGISIADAGREILSEMAKRSQQTPQTRSGIALVGDEGERKRGFMADALVHRINPQGELSEGARQFRYMSLIRMAEESLVAQGISVQGLSPMAISSRALATTSDFPAILANVLNKRLRQAYEASQPTYRQWARRAPNAPDFKSINVVQISNAPDLLKTNEAGEFKYGYMKDGKETYGVLTYGRIIGVNRQTLVNDDLRAIERVIGAFGASANRLENRTVYSQLTSNPVMGDGKTLFHSGHANLAGTGAVISLDSLSAGRSAMRKQKGLQGENLNTSPSFLLVPPDLEQIAYQYTSQNYQPTQPGQINEFRSGGRSALTPIVDPDLGDSSATAWYLAADGSTVDTVEYCYLDGSEGVYLETQMDFDSDGLKVKARLDFAAKAIDSLGLYKNPGA